MRRVVAVISIMVFAVSGCASYTPTSAPLPKAASLPTCRTEGPVIFGADPYVQGDRQKQVFGADIGSAGIIPIQVYFQNQGEKRVLVRPSDMTMTLPDGSRISPAGASAAAAKQESVAGVVVAGVAFGIIGVLVASNAEDKARAARLEDYRRKEFQESRLASGESAHGFIFFIPPGGTAAFSSAILQSRCIDIDDASTSSVLELPLKDLKFQPPTPKEEEPAKQ